jgi:hypothetical protein
MNYTKGEWFVDLKKEEGGYHVSLAPTDDEDGESIAFVYPNGKSTKANAHLISAASDMYEVLLYMPIEAFHVLPPSLKDKYVKVLAKAEGRIHANTR